MLLRTRMRTFVRSGAALLLTSAMALAVSGCAGGTTTVTTAAKQVEPTAAQIDEKASAEAAARKEQVARKREEAKEAAATEHQEAKEAAEKRKQEAHERHEEQAREATGSSGGGSSSSGGSKTVPSDLINKTLTDAENELNGMDISFSTNSYGHIVVLRGDWGVCSTTPAPGQPVSGTVVLNLGHFSCGA
jgi:hypothetical protein